MAISNIIYENYNSIICNIRRYNNRRTAGTKNFRDNKLIFKQIWKINIKKEIYCERIVRVYIIIVISFCIIEAIVSRQSIYCIEVYMKYNQYHKFIIYYQIVYLLKHSDDLDGVFELMPTMSGAVICAVKIISLTNNSEKVCMYVCMYNRPSQWIRFWF